MLGAVAKWSFMCTLAVAQIEVSSLRGRRVQWNGDSNQKVVPQCVTGYNDVSGGSAYYWSCAFHCQGGQYFATEGCICACLTPAQEAAWRGVITTLPPAPFDPSNEPTRDPSDFVNVVITPPPETTRPTFAPPREIPVGNVDGDLLSSPTAPPGGADPAPGNDAAETTQNPADDESGQTKPVYHNEALELDVAMIALIIALSLAGLALLGLCCLNWRTLTKMCSKEPVEKTKPKFADAPVLRIHADPRWSDQPSNFALEVRSSRASSKMSTASASSDRPLVVGSSRKSSKASNDSFLPQTLPQKDTRSLLKLPRSTDGDAASTVSGASATNSIESLASWANEARRPSLQLPEQSIRSIGGSYRTSSRGSVKSQDGTSSINSAMLKGAKPKRKISTVQPAEAADVLK